MAGSIQSIERAAAVLDLLSQSSKPMSLREIAMEMQLPKATVHGIVRTLVELEFVEQDDAGGAYSPGARQDGAAATPIDGNVLRSVAMSWADTLASLTGAEVRLAVLAEHGALVVHHVFRPDDSPQRLRIEEELPLHASASGKVLLAYAATRDRIMRNLTLERFTANTIVTRSVLAAEIIEIRRRGLAVDNAEYEVGVGSIAVPIHGRSRGSVAAVSVLGSPAHLFRSGTNPRDQILIELRRTAGAVTQALAHQR